MVLNPKRLLQEGAPAAFQQEHDKTQHGLKTTVQRLQQQLFTFKEAKAQQLGCFGSDVITSPLKHLGCQAPC